MDSARRPDSSAQDGDEKFRLLVSGVKDYAILMLDPDGKITTWNEGAQRIKGYRAEEIIGEHFSKFYTREAIEKGHPEYELKIAAEQGRYEEEGWRVRKDGGISGPVVSTKASEGAKYIAEKMATKRIAQIKGIPTNGNAKPAAPAKAPAPKPAATPAAAPVAGGAPAAPAPGGAKAPPPWLKKQ